MSAESDLSVLRERADRDDASAADELRRLADAGNETAADRLLDLTSEDSE